MNALLATNLSELLSTVFLGQHLLQTYGIGLEWNSQSFKNSYLGTAYFIHEIFSYA